MGFYEPLHESLATMTLRTMPLMRPGSTDSRHPEPERPYFEDFAPLLSSRDRGVIGYREGFAYDDFLAEPGVELPQLAAYLESLASLARSRGKIAVLKHCRTGGRLAWMRRNVPDAKHIAVVRSPLGQWRSGWRLFVQQQNAYFIATPLMILARYHNHARFACTLRALKVSPDELATLTKHRRWKSAGIIPTDLYRAFLAYWVSFTYTTLLHADDIIDTERLTSGIYRREVEGMIHARTGIPIEFSSVRSLSLPTWTTNISHTEIERCNEDAASALPALAALEPTVASERHAFAASLIREKLRMPFEELVEVV
jgi:hypothetical protein